METNEKKSKRPVISDLKLSTLESKSNYVSKSRISIDDLDSARSYDEEGQNFLPDYYKLREVNHKKRNKKDNKFQTEKIKKIRRFRVDDDQNGEIFTRNDVKTTVYYFQWMYLWTFLPLNLLHQFRRIANIYFLIISVFQVSTDLSPTSKYATIFPLCIVLSVTMLKEGFEDWKRYKQDMKINRSKTTIFRRGQFEERLWEEIKVGDIVKVKNNEQIPADIIILSSSGSQGRCYIESANLDGETNLKLRYAINETSKMSLEELASFDAKVECEAPNIDLYKFDGCIKAGGEDIPVKFDNVVWRGCQLKNTNYLLGVVIFTGQETKLILNSRQPSNKMSKVESMVNTSIIIIFVTLALMCSISTMFHATWLNEDEQDHNNMWYLAPILKDQSSLDTASTWITFLILYNNLVPISLYVSLEFVKLVQAHLINNDILMYDESCDTPALARTSNLNEDLGQIEYIFSDKTGTLTCNEMAFKKCSVGGVLYGNFQLSSSFDGKLLKTKSNSSFAYDEKEPITHQVSSSKDSFVFSNLQGQSISEINSDVQDSQVKDLGMGSEPEKGYNFFDKYFLRDLKESENKHREKMEYFLLCMALCHTVIPEENPETGEVAYQASSPDEAALVLAAKKLGYFFFFRGNKYLKLKLASGNEKETVFEILNVNEFHSDRKRMSVLVKEPKSGKLFLFCKGADEVMIPLMKKSEKESKDCINMVSHLFEFGTEGLRTLVLGMKEIDPKWYELWNARFLNASASMNERERQMKQLAEEIEVDMELVGATAIEDKLQEGVPETIEALSNAGIKVWMLTGDKMETAVNIGYSCSLLNDQLDQIRVDEPNPLGVAIEMSKTIKKYEKTLGQTNELALVITGRSLIHVFGRVDLSILFFQLCKMVKVVIACRVIPAQKAEIVRLIRNGILPEPTTLAIGDGANDVVMLQEAHVGVGISGNEGMQAVRASDYAFSQFRYLQQLLLVHGHWNYRRICFLILYSFYKNITVVLTLFFFGFANGFSGTTLYESWLGAGWNVGWTLLPVLFFGVFEKSLHRKTILENPHVYENGQRHLEFGPAKMAQWVCNALIHAIIIYSLCYFSLENAGSVGQNGKEADLFLTGTIINICTVLTVTYKIMLEIQYWVAWTFVGFALSLVFWCVFVVVYSDLLSISFDFFGIAEQMFNRPSFYLIVLFVPISAILLDILYQYIMNEFFPTPLRIVKEREYLKTGTSDFSKLKIVKGPPKRLGTMTLFSKVHAANEFLDEHLENLDEILQSKEKDLNEAKEIVSNEKSRESKRVVMHPITLKFYKKEQFEKEYDRQFIDKSVKFVRNSFVLIFLLLVLYLVIFAFLGDPKLLLRAVLTFVAAVALMFVFSSYFRVYYHEMMFTLLLIAGICRTFLVTDNGAVGVGLFAIVVFLVMRVRFIHAALIISVDTVFYAVWSILTDVETDQIVRIVMLQISIVFFCGYWLYQQEKSYRLNFLLQKDFEKEQRRSRLIIDNIMPPYVSKHLYRRDTDAAPRPMLGHIGSEISLALQNQAKSPREKQVRKLTSNSIRIQRELPGKRVVAFNEEEVSILFCDLTKFHNLVTDESIGPSKFVRILDRIWTAFDELCVENGVQKMETVGKTFMACAGLEGTRADHQFACAELAHSMLNVMEASQEKNANLSVRIGIHTGYVKSGVVGYVRRQFSLFGDTVNTASRIQSKGKEGHIQISEATYQALKNDYRCIKRPVDMKGLKEKHAYLLMERISQIPKSRRTEIVRKRKKDSQVIKEAYDLIKNHEHIKHFDPYDAMSHRIEIDKYSLRFSNYNEEKTFKKSTRKKSKKMVRQPVLAAGLFSLIELIYHLIWNEDASDSGLKILVGLRCSYFLLCCAMYMLSYSSHFQVHPMSYIVCFFFIGMSVQVAVPFVSVGEFKRIDTLGFILLMSLMSNSGVIRFIPNAILNGSAMIAWIIMAFVFSTSNECTENCEDTTLYELLIFIFAATIINGISSYGREYYSRRDEAEEVLFSMLPEFVADNIKEGKVGHDDHYDNITILYSDIKGFTSYCNSTENAANVVKLLYELFSKFDHATEVHGVYKVQTIGDAYVLVGGLPFVPANINEDEDESKQHARNVVEMAIDMQRIVSDQRTIEGNKIAMRIGINTGSIVAGVVGTKSLRYDIWGSDCIVANKLESEGIPYGVVVSESTKRLIEDTYPVEPHEKILISAIGVTVESYKVVFQLDESESSEEERDAVNWS